MRLGYNLWRFCEGEKLVYILEAGVKARSATKEVIIRSLLRWITSGSKVSGSRFSSLVPSILYESVVNRNMPSSPKISLVRPLCNLFAERATTSPGRPTNTPTNTASPSRILDGGHSWPHQVIEFRTWNSRWTWTSRSSTNKGPSLSFV